MSSTITALTSGGGLAMAGDTSGQLELKTNNGTTAVTISTAQVATFAKDASINGVVVGTGGGNVAYNTAVGAGTLGASNQTGAYNSYFGLNAASANTTGNYNSAFGAYTLTANTTGSSNTAFGQAALYSNIGATGNTAIGHQAAYSNNTGNGNTAIGYQALRSNAGGSSNIAIGNAALYTNSNDNSVAVGYSALSSSTGTNNVALGNYAGSSISTGTGNILLGTSAGQNGGTASYNVLIGMNAAYQISSGSGNTSINPRTDNNTYAPCLNITNENNRISMGSTAVTNAYVQVSWTVLSDARDKTNVNDAPYGLDFINQLRPVTYQWDKRNNYEDGIPNGTHLEPKLQLGFLAQDVIDIELKNGATAKDLLIGDDEHEDSLKVTEAKLIPVLVKAIQELNAKVEAQALEIKALKGVA